MDVPANKIVKSEPDVQPNRGRRKKSIVWDHFTIETINTDCIRAFCKQCKKSFAYISGSKLAGTSHLKRHISLGGSCPVKRCNNQEKDQCSTNSTDIKPDISANNIVPPRKRCRANPGRASVSFNQDLCGREIAKMIIQHGYPLHMVEHSGFIDFAKCLHPKFTTVSSNTVEEHILSIYLREKQKLRNLVVEIPGRVSFTLDLWTSDQRVSYALLTGHFTGCDWKLHRRVFNFIILPDSETAFDHAIAASLNDWSVEGKLFTLTIDQSNVNENEKRNLRGFLSIKNSHILKGQLLIESCYACTLTRLAQDALGFFQVTVQKVRDSVKYVKVSEAREERFIKLKKQLQVPSTKSLIVDDLTKWNTTYQMLVAASELKEVFSCLDTYDPDYVTTLSKYEWIQVETLCKYLRQFYEAAEILTASTYPTTNTFFDIVWTIQHVLMQGTSSTDLYVSNFMKPLLERFTIYWEDCKLVLAVAAVMDPRFKMQCVEFSFSRIYGQDADYWIRIVDEDVHELYLQYVVQCLPPPTFIVEGNEGGVKTEMPDEEAFLANGDMGFAADTDIYISDIMNGQQMKSELDQYLEEPVQPRVQDFDALGWWRDKREKYPTLSKMAFDVLSIPVSTVSPDSVFDTRTRKMDNYRSSLRPAVLQALVCAEDWLRYEHSEIPFRNTTEVPSTFF